MTHHNTRKLCHKAGSLIVWYINPIHVPDFGSLFLVEAIQNIRDHALHRLLGF